MARFDGPGDDEGVPTDDEEALRDDPSMTLPNIGDGEGESIAEEPGIEEPQEGRRLGPMIGAGVLGLALVGIIGGIAWSNLGGGSKGKEELPFGGSAAVQQSTEPAAASSPSVPPGAPSMPLPSSAPEATPSAAPAPSSSPAGVQGQGGGNGPAQSQSPMASVSGQGTSSVPQTQASPTPKDIGGSSNLKSTTDGAVQPATNSPSSDATVQSLTTRVAKLEEEVSKLEGRGPAKEAREPKVNHRPHPRRGSAHRDDDEKTSGKAGKSVSSEKASVKAIVPGQAWINVGERTLVVHRGDSVPGLGVVKTIDADKGIVTTAGGAIK